MQALRSWTITIFLVLGVASEARAGLFSNVSVLGLANMSQLTLTSSGGAEAVTRAKTGFGGGLLAAIDLAAGVLGLESGALYVKRKYSDDAAEYTETRVEVPVLLRLRIGPIGIGGGVYAAKGLGSLVLSVGDAQKYASRGLTSMDFGWTGSTSYLLKSASSSIGLLIDGRYSKSLKNVSNSSGVTGLYANIQLLAGVQISL